MTVEELLALIPEKELAFLAVETKVNHKAKKLSGLTVFKLILFSMLHSKRLSLRIMESFFLSAHFKSFALIENTQVRYNSIRDRISTIKADYFEQIFNLLFTIYNEKLGEQKALIKADSTYVNISARLVNWSMKNGREAGQKKQVKYSMSLKGSLPCQVRVFTEQKYISENIALSEAILHTLPIEESVVTFDRGIQSRKVFEQFSKNNILFVGRTKKDCWCKTSRINRLPIKPKESTVTLDEDITGYLKDRTKKITKTPFRLIKGTIDKSQESICFITNYFEADAYEIAAIYKSRWEIEVFFKFLKQHLHLTHITSRNENAIKVMIYMTLILAILILVYKKLNHITSNKIATLRFEIELDNFLLKEIVLLCGGDPAKAAYLWNTS